MMTDIAQLIADMVRSGVDPDIIGRTAAAFAARGDDQAERRRAGDRERKRVARLRNSADSADNPSPVPPFDKEIPPTPPKEITSPLTPSPAAQPRDLDRLQDRLLEAAGLSGFRDERSIGLVNLSPILALLERGYGLDADILPVVRNLSRRPGAKPPKSWAYFVDAVVDAHAAKAAIPMKPAPAAEDWAGRLKVWREDDVWGAWGPRPGEPGCRVPPELLVARVA